MSANRKPSVAGFQSRAEHQGKDAFQAESFWERTVNSVPDLIAILDRDYQIVRVNQPMAEKLGCSPEQCIGLLCYECIHGAKAPPAFCPHTLALADGKEHAAEVHEDRLGGYFLVTTSPLRDDAGQVVGSVHVARDITEQKKTRDILRHLLEASDHERQLISYEIHDGLAQQLAGALMQLDAYDCLKGKNPAQAAWSYSLGVQMLRDGLAETRRLIGNLRPPQLEEGEIVSAIDDLVCEANKRCKIKIEFCSNVGQLKLAPMLENTVFRIVQEGLTNACHHSKSKRVKVELSQQDDHLRIEVRDWGVGFKVDRVDEGHFGLEGIHERAKVFGGRAVIKSAPRKGTDIVVELPLNPVSAATSP
jgi:PAS domain S-box-containing protein